MFMEAVMESLKDLEVRNPNADQPTSSFSSLSVAAVEPSDKGASWQEISRQNLPHSNTPQIQSPKPLPQQQKNVSH